MPISFQCPECARSFNLRDELAGKKARCKCGAAIQVPQPAAPTQQSPPVDPLLGPLAANQPAADPLMGSMPPAQPPVDPLMGPQAVDPLAGSVSPATPSAVPAGGGGTGMHIGVKVGAGVGGVAVLGLLVWLGISLLGGDSETGPAGDAETVAGTDLETGTGDGGGQETTSAEPQASAGQARQPPVEQPQQPASGAPSVPGELTDQQVADILEPLVGEFEGTAVARVPDGMVQEEFSITITVRWVEEGKLLEMLHSEQHEQRKQELIFTKSYDREEQRFVLTRRIASDPEPEIFKPFAYETYDAKTRTFHGVVVEGLLPDSTFTWTMQLIDDDRFIYTGEFRSNGKVQFTHTETRQRVTGQQVPDAKNDLSAALSGNRLHLTHNGENFWAEFHSDGSCYRGQGAKRSPTKAQWTVRGNRVKVLERSDDDYLVFADLTARPDSEVIFLNSADRAESEGTKGIIVRVEPIPPASEIPDPREMVQGIANALAANDYDAFTKFTCLGMKKEEFKQFMDDNGDGKVIRVWDRAKDDFQAELKTNMHEAFLEILEEAQEEGFDWSQAKVIECEFTDDVKAELVSGSVELSLHLDDCFVTPQGLLMFDVPRAR